MLTARDKMRQILITTNSNKLDQKWSICNVIAHLVCFLDKINAMWCSVKLGQPKTYQVLKNVSCYSYKMNMTIILLYLKMTFCYSATMKTVKTRNTPAILFLYNHAPEIHSPNHRVLMWLNII